MVDQKTKKSPSHIVLTSHPDRHGNPTIPIHWGAGDMQSRGPIIASTTNPAHRNAIGTHSGAYVLYQALAVASGALDPDHKPDLTNTAPAVDIVQNANWSDPEKIVSMDPFGHIISKGFQSYLDQGYDIRPSIAVTKAHIHLPEIEEAISAGRLIPDGHVLLDDHSAVVTKVAVEPVWHLPGIATRFKCSEEDLRRILFEKTAGMYPELVTRPDLKVFLPPIGGATVYLFGDVTTIADPKKPLNVRVHDECNGSDVFGSDICTCRPYLVHGIELCIQSAQESGAGVIVYNRKEGRALGEVTKFLVYNARKRQEGGDRADKYFERTECVAGVQDMRFQELMPDVLLWLGVKTIDKLASMSHMKFNALAYAGIDVKERVSLPDELISKEAHVEIEAKKAAGYFSSGDKPTTTDLTKTKGRGLDQ